MTVFEWFSSIDWGALLERIVLPATAILVSAGIAIWLANRERKDAAGAREQERLVMEAGRQKERRLEAGAGVLTALAPLVSLNPQGEPMYPHMRELRARLAVYRAWIEKDDRSGDWLGLRHREIMTLWNGSMDDLAQSAPVTDQDMIDILDQPRRAVADTIEMFGGWLSGHIPMTDLLKDGARILNDYHDERDVPIAAASPPAPDLKDKSYRHRP